MVSQRKKSDDGQSKPALKLSPCAFPVICLGASAGGLEALEAFVEALPAQSGMAFVAVTHTDPDRSTLLPELLAKKARAAVMSIQEGMSLEPDTIYVPPSNREAVIATGVFHLQKRPAKSVAHMPIDRFCRHLARTCGEHSGCILLSGTGSDGTQGLKTIKEEGGLVMAQDRQSALHPGMPGSAIETGLVDYVLKPFEMPRQLIEYYHHPAAVKPVPKSEAGKGADCLNRILAFMVNRTRHDFSHYKTSTLVRRIERRMTIARSKDMDAYLRFLHQQPAEPQALFQDLLIGVTSFFRDTEAYAHLKKKILPDLIARSPEGDMLRVWIPGCSTGEEAFSVAIVIKECLEEQNLNREIQIFATDIDAKAIEKARQGVYLRNIAADVSGYRLKRFFHQSGQCYHVKREIRELVVFAEQNILHDPPFSNLDLLVCRNLLIYLKADAQNKLLPLFHYTLKPNGILFLGSSESLARFAEFFVPLSKTFNFYQKRETVVRTQIDFPTGAKIFRDRSGHPAPEAVRLAKTANHRNVTRAVEAELLKAHTPTCIVVDQVGEIIHIHGRTGKYLEPAQGKFSTRITEMAREGLRFPLMSALRQVREKKSETVREYGLRIRTNGDYQRAGLTVKAIDQPPLKACLMVLLEELPDLPDAEDPAGGSEVAEAESHKLAELEQELLRVNQDYRSALEEIETSNEELKSINEEMHSSNEELQSTNEELESSREELQSLNEELSTVNSELHSKIRELNEAYNAITHVLQSTHIAVIFLDTDLKIQRYTHEAARLINLIDSDIGRPIAHISHNLEFDDLKGTAKQVLNRLTSFEDDVCTKDGQWYRMSIRIHRAEEHVIEGLVLTFINIDTQKTAQQTAERIRSKQVESGGKLVQSVIEVMPTPVLMLDAGMHVVSANTGFYRLFDADPERTEGDHFFKIAGGNPGTGKLENLLRQLATDEETIEVFEIEETFERISTKRLRITGRRLSGAQNGDRKLLLVIEDRTGA